MRFSLPVRCLANAMAFAVLAGCGRGAGPAKARVWHTFDADEAPTLEWALASAPVPASARPVPFARAQNVIRAALERGGDECPDVARVDAAWIPGFAERGLLQAAPANLGGGPDAVLPAARALAESGGKLYGIAQTYGCVAVLERRADGELPPRSLDELEARMAAGRAAGQPVDVRPDGFSALPWIFAEGGDLIDLTQRPLVVVDGQAAERALTRLSRLAALAPAEGDPAARFAAHQIDVLIDGPWVLRRLAGAPPDARLRIDRFPSSPDGRPSAPVVGQVWVVGACTRDAGASWRLVEHLVSDPVAGRFAQTAYALPARRALAEHVLAPVAEFARACPLRLLPRHPISAALYEDLTPAVAAVLAGRASPAEALADLAASWRRLLSQGGYAPASGIAGDAGIP
jgi:arabinogalactan oligomer/maltooligosaccharide transport system substrate-binding protein